MGLAHELSQLGEGFAGADLGDLGVGAGLLGLGLGTLQGGALLTQLGGGHRKQLGALSLGALQRTDPLAQGVVDPALIAATWAWWDGGERGQLPLGVGACRVSCRARSVA